MQIVRGFCAPFRGVLFVSRHGLWGYLVAPFLINLGVAAAAGYWGGGWLADWLTGGWAQAGWTGAAAGVARFLVFTLVSALAFVVLQPVLSAPFIDLLTEKCERIVLGAAPSVGVLRSAVQAIAHGVLKLALYALALGFTLLAGALTGFGGLLGAALYGIFLAYDGFDYPLARRQASFGAKWRYLLSRGGQTVGYCCAAGLFFLIPLAALLAPSFAAVGATLLFLETEASEATDRTGAAPSSRRAAGAAQGESHR